MGFEPVTFYISHVHIITVASLPTEPPSFYMPWSLFIAKSVQLFYLQCYSFFFWMSLNEWITVLSCYTCFLLDSIHDGQYSYCVRSISTKFQNAQRARAAVNRQGYFRICCWYWKRVVLIAIIRRKVSVSKLKSPSRLSTNYRNTAFERFEAGASAADVSRSFGCNERLIHCLQTCFRQTGSKNNKPPPGRPRKMTPLEVRVIVASTWRNFFMAARKLLKRLRHATGARISVYTVRNRLRDTSLIFESWSLNFDVWFCWRKWINFQNVLLKMFTFIEN